MVWKFGVFVYNENYCFVKGNECLYFTDSVKYKTILSESRYLQKDFLATIPTQTFEDVAGNTVAKKELQNLVMFLTEPEKFAAMGCTIPKGILLSGKQ